MNTALVGHPGRPLSRNWEELVPHGTGGDRSSRHRHGVGALCPPARELHPPEDRAAHRGVQLLWGTELTPWPEKPLLTFPTGLQEEPRSSGWGPPPALAPR